MSSLARAMTCPTSWLSTRPNQFGGGQVDAKWKKKYRKHSLFFFFKCALLGTSFKEKANKAQKTW